MNELLELARTCKNNMNNGMLDEQTRTFYKTLLVETRDYLNGMSDLKENAPKPTSVSTHSKAIVEDPDDAVKAVKRTPKRKQTTKKTVKKRQTKTETPTSA